MLAFVIGAVLFHCFFGRLIVGYFGVFFIFSLGFSHFFLLRYVGVFLIVEMQFYAPFLLFDDFSIGKSIKSTLQLVWGNWWRTFGVMIVSMLIVLCLMFPFMLVNFLMEYIWRIKPQTPIFQWISIAE